MGHASKIPRRDFIWLSLFTGGSLALGISNLKGADPKIEKISAGDPAIALTPYILIDPSGKITLFNHRPEMGQGTYQAIPMLLAEELEVDINQVEIVQSPADRSKYGDQMVVGSRSIRGNYDLVRGVGASAREMLIAAAATQWKSNAGECYAENGWVIHRASGKKLSYGALAKDASGLPVPKNPSVKDPKEFKIIGKSIARQDIPMKISGRAEFGIDCALPGMLYASIEHSPLFHARLVSFDDQKAKSIPGVTHVLKTKRTVFGLDREGVAVVAESYWAALQGRRALQIVWDNSGLEGFSTEKIKADYKNASGNDAVQFESRGQFRESFENAAIKIEASYDTPYQTHAPMEPMNALVSVEKDRCEFWGSTQNPNGVRSFLAQFCNLPEEKVTVHYTFMGGGFGRRSMPDIAEEAADLSIKTGKPIKLLWTREDDLTQGPFRACSLNVCKGGLNAEGKLVALEHKVICQDIQNQTGNNDRASGAIAGGINTVYEIPNFRIAGILRKFHIPIYYWRSVYHSTNCFAHESFIDELAHAANKDPLEFRLSILKNHRRYTKVLKTVAEQSGWSAPPIKDRAKGVAIVERSGAYTAMVVEIERVDHVIKPVKVTAAVDCGLAVNPDIIRAQMEGCIVMGLTATYKSGLTIEKGRVAEQNFDKYKMLLLHECPEIEVIVIDTQDPPEGAGEASLPTVAPALANAIFTLTGKRIRSLPFRLNEI
ncbi:MAG: molybdopterin cofactor-binding domain-containing protein [Chitinophagales bacterium]